MEIENGMDQINKAGFVNIIGNPNVGKSTLMNALVGEKLSIVTAKAQTTRHRIMGIVNGEDYQIVFSDTPGILKPNYMLQESMMDFVETAIGDADIILYVTDVVEKIDKNIEYINKLNQVECPVIIAINKIDETKQEKVVELVEKWHATVPKAEILPISALNKFNVDVLLARLVELLPQQHAWYDRDVFTDKSMRFFASEIIREKILLNYNKEIPYCTEVVIDAFEENEDIYNIEAVILVMRESQKGIIIGPKGLALKRVGMEARKDMEKFFEKTPQWEDLTSVNLKKFNEYLLANLSPNSVKTYIAELRAVINLYKDDVIIPCRNIKTALKPVL